MRARGEEPPAQLLRLSQHDRRVMHDLARYYGLSHASENDAEGRVLHIRFTADTHLSGGVGWGGMELGERGRA